MSIIGPCGDDYYAISIGHCSNVWNLYAVSLDHGIGAVMGTSTTLYRADHGKKLKYKKLNFTDNTISLTTQHKFENSHIFFFLFHFISCFISNVYMY